MSKSVFGIATTHGQAEKIVEELQAQRFPWSEISVLMPDKGGTRDVGPIKATKAPEGAVTRWRHYRSVYRGGTNYGRA